MKPGPPPKPSVIKIREGLRGHRPANTNEPRFRAAALDAVPIAEIGSLAKRIWDEYLSAAEGSDLIRATDLTSLAVLCQEQATALLIGQHVEACVAELKSSGAKLHPDQVANLRHLARIYGELSEASRKKAHEFGFTPAARSRLNETALQNNPVDEALFA